MKQTNPDNPAAFSPAETERLRKVIKKMRRNIWACASHFGYTNRQIRDFLPHSGMTPTQVYRFRTRWRRRNLDGRALRAVLKKTGGNISAAARRLGCHRRQLQRYLGPCNTAPAPYARHAIRGLHGRISRDRVVKDLRMTGGNVSAAARHIGCQRRQLQRLVRRYAITDAEAPGLHKGRGLPTGVSRDMLVKVLRTTEGNVTAAALSMGYQRWQLHSYLRRFNLKPARFRTYHPQGRSRGASRDMVVKVLRMTGGNVSTAARRIGCHRRQLQRLIRGYDISAADAPGLHKARRGPGGRPPVKSGE